MCEINNNLVTIVFILNKEIHYKIIINLNSYFTILMQHHFLTKIVTILIGEKLY